MTKLEFFRLFCSKEIIFTERRTAHKMNEGLVFDLLFIGNDFLTLKNTETLRTLKVETEAVLDYCEQKEVCTDDTHFDYLMEHDQLEIVSAVQEMYFVEQFTEQFRQRSVPSYNHPSSFQVCKVIAAMGTDSPDIPPMDFLLQEEADLKEEKELLNETCK